MNNDFEYLMNSKHTFVLIEPKSGKPSLLEVIADEEEYLI